MEQEVLHALAESVAKIAAGEVRGIDKIYDAVGGRMLSVALGVVKNRALAEEVVQDSFLKIAKSASQFRRRDNAYAWILTIVRNTALNKLKSEKRRSGTDLEQAYGLFDARADVERTENAVLVGQALAVLSEEEKGMVCDRYFGELTVREIAAKRGIPKSTVARMLERAEAKMRNALSP